MTLILTVLSKHGVCVCADKRYKTGSSSEPIKFEDTHKKIFKFKKIPLIIFNHGVNRFGNKYWDQFCEEYEQSDRWLNTNFIQIVDDFKNFIEKSVVNEVVKNLPDANVAGFVLCGKTTDDNKFKVKELFWQYKSNDICFIPIRHKHNLIGSGIAYIKYLDNLIRSDNSLNKDDYWKKLTLDKAKKELEKLYSIAIKEKNKIGGDDFSDNYDIECIV
ncbi:MAG: hypothetical protein UV73_C0011G0046 [Candidatus Gottesmanbacteria bacterium GW2011_GWA2_43_14]|uniref:Uncharacterized protein n=1 Tax=Candidatus Gottesmanbacteria bacterium GW2011_GWA2_43_14 TaxID=1618443 RepID=A0A0G1DFG2_9BACT|nr:MAG: hypothetical protein UV73_C0011G0046 [Candidatus Gottesmanbacteria bacterium GW2011_GWA2_43_14]